MSGPGFRGSYGVRAVPVGTCVDAFDEDGRCVVDALPWSDATEFAVAEEGARILTREQFVAAVGVEVPDVEARYLEADGILMLRDLDEDVHTFYAA